MFFFPARRADKEIFPAVYDDPVCPWSSLLLLSHISSQISSVFLVFPPVEFIAGFPVKPANCMIWTHAGGALAVFVWCHTNPHRHPVFPVLASFNFGAQLALTAQNVPVCHRRTSCLYLTVFLRLPGSHLDSFLNRPVQMTTTSSSLFTRPFMRSFFKISRIDLPDQAGPFFCQRIRNVVIRMPPLNDFYPDNHAVPSLSLHPCRPPAGAAGHSSASRSNEVLPDL